MENSLKLYFARYFTNLLTVVTCLGAAYIGYDYYQAKEKEKEERKLLEERYAKLNNTQDPFVQLSQNIGQLATLYKEQADLSKDVAMMWKDLAIERGERVKLTSNTAVTVDNKAEAQDKSDFTMLTPDGQRAYSVNELRIAGKDSPPIGYILVKNDGEVMKQNYKYEIHIESAELKDDLTGKIRIVSRAYLVPLENGLADKERPDLKKWKDQKFPLAVTGGETIVDPQEPMFPDIRQKGFVPWTLNLNGGFGVFGGRDGGIDTKATVDLALAGYGYSKRNLDWKFAQVGFNYSKTGGLGLHLMPFSYRPFPTILTNTYIGPGVYFAPDSSGYFVGLNIGF